MIGSKTISSKNISKQGLRHRSGGSYLTMILDNVMHTKRCKGCRAYGASYEPFRSVPQKLRPISPQFTALPIESIETGSFRHHTLKLVNQQSAPRFFLSLGCASVASCASMLSAEHLARNCIARARTRLVCSALINRGNLLRWLYCRRDP